jgi:hypothetical protein
MNDSALFHFLGILSVVGTLQQERGSKWLLNLFIELLHLYDSSPLADVISSVIVVFVINVSVSCIPTVHHESAALV